MEGRKSFIYVLFLSFLLVGLSRGADPRSHPNLSPFEQWHSAYECLQNTSSSCPDKYQLKPKGWVNVTASDTALYCNNGCADHTKMLLKCLDDVMRGKYKFESNQTVRDINVTIATGCAKGFTGTALYSTSSARMLQVSKTMTYALAFVAWLSISYINM